MKKKEFHPLIITFVLILLCSSCGGLGDVNVPGANYKNGNSDNNDDDNNGTYTYLATANYGDVIQYTITSERYEFTNETTDYSSEGDLLETSDMYLRGFEKIVDDYGWSYICYSPQKAMVTTNPSGRDNNQLVFGLTSDVDLDSQYSSEELTGKYIFFAYNNLSDLSWGGLEIKADGTYTYGVVPEGVAPEDWTDAYFSGTESGIPTWEVDSMKKSRVKFTESGYEFTGTIYTGGAVLIDNGPAQGFTLGLKYPDEHLLQEKIADTYYSISYKISSGEKGIGFYSLPSAGNDAGWYRHYPSSFDASTLNSEITVSAVNAVSNMFRVDAKLVGFTKTTYLVILPGEIIAYFTVYPAGGLSSYGIGIVRP
jgi:hypothetical protein